jgi:DNA (cytosine-5)-methyltransferase 1
VPELKRLFGFPDEYEFIGSRSAVQSQIGNAVPPPVAAAVATSLFGPSSHLL